MHFFDLLELGQQHFPRFPSLQSDEIRQMSYYTVTPDASMMQVEVDGWRENGGRFAAAPLCGYNFTRLKNMAIAAPVSG